MGQLKSEGQCVIVMAHMKRMLQGDHMMGLSPMNMVQMRHKEMRTGWEESWTHSMTGCPGLNALKVSLLCFNQPNHIIQTNVHNAANTTVSTSMHYLNTKYIIRGCGHGNSMSPGAIMILYTFVTQKPRPTV